MDQTTILDIERACLDTRRQLNVLIQEYYDGNGSPEAYNQIYRDKILFLETEVKHLENQIQMLKGTPQPMQQPVQQPAQQQVQQSVQSPYAKQPAQSPYANSVYNRPHVSHRQEPKKQKSYESMLGKNLMAVFASVLIFISLGIFAAVVFPFLDDVIRMVLMLVFSLGLTAIGARLHKNPSNNFHAAIMACGMGSLYITLLMGNMAFHVLNEIALYALILVWAVSVKAFTRVRNTLFTVIGQCGIFISTVLGTTICTATDDSFMFFCLALFYIIASAIIAGTNANYFTEKQAYKDHLASHIGRMLNLGVLTVGLYVMDEGYMFLPTAFVLGAIILFEYWCSFREDTEDTVGNGGFHVMSSLNVFVLLWFVSALHIVPGEYLGLLLYAAAMFTILYTQVKGGRADILSFIWCFALSVLGCLICTFSRRYLFGFLLPLPMFVIGGIKEKAKPLIAGVISFALMVLVSSYEPYTFLIMVLVVSAAYLMVSYRTAYFGVSVAGYPIMCFGIMQAANSLAYTALAPDESEIIAFIIVSILHLVLSKLLWFKDDPHMRISTGLVNAALMAMACIMLDYQTWQIPVILVAVLLFVANSSAQLDEKENMGYYVAFKYTALMVLILRSFNAVNYVVSGSMLLFAIISIGYGFYSRRKPFRIYGLILSMISVAKLVLIDVHYESAIQNALSFFVCGVLLFVISFIYHKIDVGMRKNEEE